MNRIIEKIPADRRPESIADVVSIVLVDELKGAGHISTYVIHFEGTVVEKLAQYKAATGRDWRGTSESVISTTEQSGEVISLNLGREEWKPVQNPVTAEFQKKFDALSHEARCYLAENEKEKERRAAEKKLIEAQAL